ncbi:MAG: chemotaxis protein CheW [Spirochaetales bacterium]|nr:chemotaxis protein CheW [Spirochaetales bacterium]
MSTVDSQIEQLKAETMEREAVEKIDFKMVTFSLGGKDYGIDIMTVKEISKASKFTYVPNSVPYVKGVYNLRGEIISVIDLRLMFNLPKADKKEKEAENMIILRLRDYLIGIIVDTIDKVVGVSTSNIQPPHPLFGGINIKYIQGVVDTGNKLYVILDAERILGSGSFEQGKQQQEETEEARTPVEEAEVYDDVNLSFIAETLATFKSFYVSDVNRDWIEARFKTWSREKKNNTEDMQLKTVDEAESFLNGFFSPYSYRFWEEDYMNALGRHIAQIKQKMITVWNPGCGKGHETYSFTTLLRMNFPTAQLKIWGNDSDLLSISTAPSLYFQESEISDLYKKYITETQNGYQFTPNIRDVILFEYHDILHQNPFPPVDVILARDFLSFQKPANQQKIVKEFWEKLKPDGILIIGKNETGLDKEMFSPVDEKLGVFKKIV